MEKGSWVGTVAVTTFFSRLPQARFVLGTLRDGEVSQAHGLRPQKNSINRLFFPSLLPTIPMPLFSCYCAPGYLSKFVSVGGERGADGGQNEHLLSSSHSVKLWVC